MDGLRWLCARALVRRGASLIRELGAAGFVALILGGGACLVAGLCVPAYRLNWLWLGGGGASDVLLAVVLLGLVLSWTRWGTRPVRRATALGALALACVALADTASYYGLIARGDIGSAFAFPLSALVALLCGVGAAQLLRAPCPAAPVRRAGSLVVAGGLLVLVHVTAFGATDYRRPADVAVVFGAAVRPDGSPSLVLRDRTMTACDLYEQGLVDTLVLSGGRSPHAPCSEPQCMARLARARGVPEHALVFDEGGATTRASLDNVRALAAEHGWQRMLLVSHDYHLARISVAAHRRDLRAYTVPARESRAWRGKSFFVLRELAAWAWYAASDV